MATPPKPSYAPRRKSGASEPALQEAALALQSGQPQQAEWLAVDVLKRSPKDQRALQIFGSALLMQERAMDAIAPLEKAARLSQDAAVETQFAMALSEAGRSEDALAPLERAITRKPPFPPAFHIYGTLLASLERFDDAIDVVKRGLALMPNFAQLLCLLGNLLANRNDHAGAIAACRQALTHAPHLAEALWGLRARSRCKASSRRLRVHTATC